MGLSVTYNKIDRQLLEHFGPEGVLETLIRSSNKNSLFQSGQLMNYTLMFVLFLTMYIYLV